MPEPGQCAEPGCGATYKTDHWNKKRAQREGWFLQRDGTDWCPTHTPSWVADWRARKIKS